jgi:trehalose 6-phosphate phosphatase
MRGTEPFDGIPTAAWTMVRFASKRLLVLDYDGTLAPFRVPREEATPAPGVLRLLQSMAGHAHTTLVITSGRPLVELERLVGSLPVTLVGEDGWEYRFPGEPVIRHPLPSRTERRLAEAERLAQEAGWGECIERKRTAVVIHTRKLTPVRARDLEHRALIGWIDLAHRGDVLVQRIDGGVEIRARGHDTGTTARWLLSACREPTLGVFVGDDASDESGFQVMNDVGFGVRVGNCNRPSHALGRIARSEDMSAFLEEWIRVVGEPG